ncbi:MAG: hypothetical protein ACK4L4_07720 [Gemmobacter sp.]
MFKVIEDPQFVADVDVPVPDGTGWTREVLRTRFRALPLSELAALDDDGGANIADVLERVVVEFLDVVAADGTPLDGAGEWRARLLDFAFVRMALLRGYSAAMVEARLGNSEPSAASGRPAH